MGVRRTGSAGSIARDRAGTLVILTMENAENAANAENIEIGGAELDGADPDHGAGGQAPA